MIRNQKNSHLIILSVNIWNTTDTIGQIALESVIKISWINIWRMVFLIIPPQKEWQFVWLMPVIIGVFKHGLIKKPIKIEGGSKWEKRNRVVIINLKFSWRLSFIKPSSILVWANCHFSSVVILSFLFYFFCKTYT